MKQNHHLNKARNQKVPSFRLNRLTKAIFSINSLLALILPSTSYSQITLNEDTNSSVYSVVFKKNPPTTSTTNETTQTDVTYQASRTDEADIIKMLSKTTTVVSPIPNTGETASSSTTASGKWLNISNDGGIEMGVVQSDDSLVTSLALKRNGLQFYRNNGDIGGLLSSVDGQTLKWSGNGGINITAQDGVSNKTLAYNKTYATAVGGNTGLTFDGKPITPYYGVNSGDNGGNYYGNGASGSNAIAIGYGASSTKPGAIAIGYGASSANQGTIAIGQNASAANNNSIAIGWNAKTVGNSQAHGIAIGGAEEPTQAAVAARSSIAMGYNVRLDKAAHSFGFGINLHMGGYRNIAISAAGSFSSPTSVFGNGNTVIGSDNKLDGQSYTKVNDYEYNYKDIVSNAVLGEGNKIVGTAGADATPSDYSGTTGAYRNAIVGMGNTLNGNNYFNMLLASGATLATGAHHNTLLGGTITVGDNVNNSFVLGSNATLNNESHHNTLLGSGNIVNANIRGSYVLGNNVNVTANNSVYFGDASTANTTGILNTVSGGNPTIITSDVSPEDVELHGITVGETGQTSATIAGRTYRFAGLGRTGGGVITVGKVEGVMADGSLASNGQTPSYYRSVGRIIQNVAPGLIGASSTDAINGSQLYSVMTTVDAAIARVASGDGLPVVYTTVDGKRLLKEAGVFYKPEVATLNGVVYKQASNGLWYSEDSFTDGLLKQDVNISSGKALSQLASERSDGQVMVVQPSDLVLSVVNAEKDGVAETRGEATTTLTSLQNIKNALKRLSETELNDKAKELYQTETAGADDALWLDLDESSKKPWLNKATINNAQEKIALLLNETNAKVLSQAVSLQDLKTLSQAGMDFVGDDSIVVHRNIGEKLTIAGQPNYIKTIGDVNGKISIVFDDNVKNTIDNATNKDLDNLTDAGKDVIRSLIPNVEIPSLTFEKSSDYMTLSKEDIESGQKITYGLSVTEAISSTQTDNTNKLASAQSVHDAVSGARTTVSLDDNDDGILTLSDNTQDLDSLASKAYTIGINKENLVTALDNTFAKDDDINNAKITFATDEGSVDVKLNETINLKSADDNTKVSVENDAISIGLSKTLDLTQDGSVTIGNMVLNQNGLSLGDNKPSISTTGIDAGGLAITNVKTNLSADGNVLDGVSNNAINVGDVTTLINNASLRVSNNGNSVLENANGHTINFIDGNGTVATASVENKTVAVKVDVNTADIAYQEDGTFTLPENLEDGKTYLSTASNVKDMLGKLKESITNVSNETNDNITTINNSINTISNNVDALEENKANVNLDNIDADGKAVIKGLIDVKADTTTSGMSQSLSVSVDDKENDKKTFTASINLNKLEDEISLGLSGDSGTSGSVKLNQSLALNGDNYIEAKVNDNAISLDLKNIASQNTDVVDGGSKLITGGILFNLLNNYVKTDASNFTESGINKIKEYAMAAIDVISATANNGINVNKDTSVANKTTFKLSLDADKVKELAGTTSLSNDLNSKANADASNINGGNVEKWQTALGKLTFTGDDGEVKKQLGETLSVKGGLADKSLASDGKNVAVIAEGDTLNVKLAKNLEELESVTFGDNVVLSSSNTNGEKSFNIADKDGNAVKITGVKDGVNDNDAINMKQLKDLKNEINLAVTSNTTSVTAQGATVTKTNVGEQGAIYEVKVDNLINRVSDNNEPIIKAADGKYYKQSDIANIVYINNGWYKANNGTLEAVQAPTAINPQEGKLSINDNVLIGVKSGIGGEVSSGNNTFIENLSSSKNDIAVNSQDIKNVVKTGINVGVNDSSQTLELGKTLNFVAGNNINITQNTENGKHNVVINAVGQAIVFTNEVGDQLVNVGGKYYKITDVNNGVVNSSATEQMVSSTSINSDKPVTMKNVKSAVDSSNGFENGLTELINNGGENYVATTGDLHNMQQNITSITQNINQKFEVVNNNINFLNKEVNVINNKLNRTVKEMRGIGASAAAMANLPQVTSPGQKLFSMAVGTYRDSKAIAVGVSRMSDNGRYILKASMTHNSNDEVSAGVGFGMRW